MASPLARIRWWLADRLRPNTWPSTAAQHGVLLNEVRELTKLIEEFADHQSWRCAHADAGYYFVDGPPDDGDCACGLLSALKRAGIDPEPWRPKEHHAPQGQ